MFIKVKHRTKYQESVNGNVEEIRETVAETRRLTRVSAIGLVTFTRVSVAAVTAELYHFLHVSVRFQLVSVFRTGLTVNHKTVKIFSRKKKTLQKRNKKKRKEKFLELR